MTDSPGPGRQPGRALPELLTAPGRQSRIPDRPRLALPAPASESEAPRRRPAQTGRAPKGRAEAARRVPTTEGSALADAGAGAGEGLRGGGICAVARARKHTPGPNTGLGRVTHMRSRPDLIPGWAGAGRAGGFAARRAGSHCPVSPTRLPGGPFTTTRPRPLGRGRPRPP